MVATARPYIPRAPRYVIRPHDKSLLRFKDAAPNGEASSATILDLSESGLLFTIQGPDHPELQETIKVEFTIPGRSQMACFATVTRVETDVEWELDGKQTSTGVRIAVRFLDLPPAFRHTLHASLSTRTLKDRILTTDTSSGRQKQMRLLRLALALAGLISAFVLMTGFH
ncbi:MAG: PilZ domain-containing protein [Bdellovibrionaceae bacterium]|nr:PilZ domain-containing protein [Pseudobdellovibrionaceae bacterium]